MTRTLEGVLAPVVTTFDAESGELAPVSFRANIRAHIASGLAGVVVAGSTGEAALLEEREREQLVEWARALVPDDRWLIAGAGGESTRQVVARARAAQDRGADAVLVVSPHYFGELMSPEALTAHFRRVADESPLPVILYNIPKYVHFPLEPALVRELAAHENIIGIKDSSGDLRVLTAYLESQSPAFTVLTGSGQGLYSALELGARGGILAVALFAARLAAGVWESFRAQDFAEAGRKQERLIPLARHIVGKLGPPGVKAAMDVAGLAGGPPRAPLLPVSATDRERVAELMRGAGVRAGG